MKNRSKEFLKKRGTLFESKKSKEKNEVHVLFSKISENLSSLEQLVEKVEKECKLYCVPTFKSKLEIVKRIEILKYEIALLITKSKGILDYFSNHFKKSINYQLVESVALHFHYKLDIIIKRINESVIKIENIKSTYSKSDEIGVESVYKSVYYINTVIIELKTLVISQSDKIERLDVAMEYVSNSAYKSVNEISSISVFGSQLKNRIITVLFCCILVLVLLSTLKAYMHSVRVVKKIKEKDELGDKKHKNDYLRDFRVDKIEQHPSTGGL